MEEKKGERQNIAPRFSGIFPKDITDYFEHAGSQEKQHAKGGRGPRVKTEQPSQVFPQIVTSQKEKYQLEGHAAVFEVGIHKKRPALN
jgi:hypothetical protein